MIIVQVYTMSQDKKRKTIYIIRHGESSSNTGCIRGDSSALLTAKGKKQSLCVARRCKRLKPEVLFSSETRRARETAEIISKICGLPVESLALLNERRPPSEVKGKRKDDPFVLDADRIIRANFHQKNYRFSDEENFEALKARSSRIFKLLLSKKERTIILVTHGILIRVLVAYAIFGENVKGYECEMCIRGLRMEKTGITALTLNENLKEEGASSRWQLWCWNDYSHLTEGGKRLLIHMRLKTDGRVSVPFLVILCAGHFCGRQEIGFSD